MENNHEKNEIYTIWSEAKTFPSAADEIGQNVWHRIITNPKRKWKRKEGKFASQQNINCEQYVTIMMIKKGVHSSYSSILKN